MCLLAEWEARRRWDLDDRADETLPWGSVCFIKKELTASGFQRRVDVTEGQWLLSSPYIVQ